jgi:hypothetical protein
MVSFICRNTFSDSFLGFCHNLSFLIFLMVFLSHIHPFNLRNHSREIQNFMVHSFATKSTRSSTRAFLSEMSRFYATVTKG